MVLRQYPFVIETLVDRLALHAIDAHLIAVDLAAGQVEAPHGHVSKHQRMAGLLGGCALREVVRDCLGVVDDDAQHLAQLTVGPRNELHHRVQVSQGAIGPFHPETIIREAGLVGPRRQALQHPGTVVGVDALEGIADVGGALLGVEAPQAERVAIPAAFTCAQVANEHADPPRLPQDVHPLQQILGRGGV